MMELGATVCHRKSRSVRPVPINHCESETCDAESFPKISKKRKRPSESSVARIAGGLLRSPFPQPVDGFTNYPDNRKTEFRQELSMAARNGPSDCGIRRIHPPGFRPRLFRRSADNLEWIDWQRLEESPCPDLTGNGLRNLGKLLRNDSGILEVLRLQNHLRGRSAWLLP